MRLLYDVMIGDSTLFSRDDIVETAWKFVEPIQKAWTNNPNIKVYGYPAGTWGPTASNYLIDGCGLTWRSHFARDSGLCATGVRGSPDERAEHQRRKHEFGL